MKKSIKPIMIFILGIIVSIIINTYFISKITSKEVSYKDNKKIESTSDPDYINGVYSSSSTLNNHITELENKTLKIQTGANSTVGNGVWCQHNVTFSPAYTSAPLVSIMPTTLFSTENIVLGTITKTGFTYSVRCLSNTFTYSTMWQAVGY